MATQNNEKARKYAGQLISIKRKSAVLSIIDRLSHVDDSTNATYLELLHPASVYRISILGDIPNGLSTEANIRPEDVKQIMMRLEFAEKQLFDHQTEKNTDKQTDKQPESNLPPAFTVQFAFGKMKGETPGGYLYKAEDKQAAAKELRSQYDFLAQNAEKFAANRKVMDAIRNAFDCYKQGTLNELAESAPQPQAKGTGQEAILYNPPEKTFRKDTKVLNDGRELTKCYLITIAFHAANNYPYQVTIRNRYCEIKKNTNTGLETINPIEGDAAELKEYKMALTSGEMVSLVNAMEENLHFYKSCVYKAMRQMDSKNQEENRKAWRPQS